MVNNDRGQSLISKYVWVIETIYRRRKISFKELNERWVDDIDISRGVDIPKRTLTTGGMPYRICLVSSSRMKIEENIVIS